MTDDALRIFLLAAAVQNLLMFERIDAAADPEYSVSLIDRIMSDARVIEGDTADATLQFGRETLLRLRDTASLFSVVHHEIGHLRLNAALARRGEAVVKLTLEAASRDLDAALPGLVSAARSGIGQPLQPDDSRRRRLPSGLSVICTIDQRQGCSYTALLADRRRWGPGPRHGPPAGPPDRPRPGRRPEGARPRALPAGRAAPRRPRTAGAAAAGGRTRCGRRRLAPRPGGGGPAVERPGDIPALMGVVASQPTLYTSSGSAYEDQTIAAQVREGADLAAAPPEVVTAVAQLAVRCADPLVLELALAAGADAHGLDYGALATSCCVVRDGDRLLYGGPTPWEATLVLKQLRDAGCALDRAVTDDGQTLLTDAAGRSVVLTTQLLRIGAQVDQTNCAGETPLIVAVRLGQADVVHALLVAGASTQVRDNDGLTALHHAAGSGASELLAALIESGADVDARRRDGSTPLMMTRSAEAAQTLLQAGAELEVRTPSGMGALAAATRRGDVEVVRHLLAAGADPDATTDLGEAPLHFAVEGHYPDDPPDLFAALLDAGADVDEEDDSGITPLMIAAVRADPGAVEYLIERGADVGIRDRTGRTALLLACDGRTEWDRDPTRVDQMTSCARLLVAAGADVDATDEQAVVRCCWPRPASTPAWWQRCWSSAPTRTPAPTTARRRWPTRAPAPREDGRALGQGRGAGREHCVTTPQGARLLAALADPSWRDTGALSLRGMDLKSLPDLTDDAPRLVSLDLAGNRLRELPDWLWTAARLEYLSVAGNRLSSVPDSIGRLAGSLTTWISPTTASMRCRPGSTRVRSCAASTCRRTSCVTSARWPASQSPGSTSRTTGLPSCRTYPRRWNGWTSAGTSWSRCLSRSAGCAGCAGWTSPATGSPTPSWTSSRGWPSRSATSTTTRCPVRWTASGFRTCAGCRSRGTRSTAHPPTCRSGWQRRCASI
jgi:ankyrin repeat protein